MVFLCSYSRYVVLTSVSKGKQGEVIRESVQIDGILAHRAAYA